MSSLPEVYENAVYYCNPYNTMEMEIRLVTALEKRIEKSLIYERVRKVRERQEKDLSALCYQILEWERVLLGAK